MKKYLTPNITLTELLTQDVITASFDIFTVFGGDSISWDALREKAGVGASVGESD